MGVWNRRQLSEPLRHRRELILEAVTNFLSALLGSPPGKARQKHKNKHRRPREGLPDVHGTALVVAGTVMEAKLERQLV